MTNELLRYLSRLILITILLIVLLSLGNLYGAQGDAGVEVLEIIASPWNISPREFVRLSISLKNHEADPVEYPLTVEVNGNSQPAGQVTLDAHSITHINREIPFSKPGTYIITVGEKSAQVHVQPATVTIETLMSDMIDLRQLAFEPSEETKSAQHTSYDRASRIVNDRKVNWSANDDSGHFKGTHRREGRVEWIMADLEGPGAIVRLWSANPRGVLRIYIDGRLKLEEDFKKVMSPNIGHPFIEPFAHLTARGYNLYFPIPFSDSAKVTVSTPSTPSDLYYHVGYKSYPENTPISSFSEEKAEIALSKNRRIAEVLSQPEQYQVGSQAVVSEEIFKTINPHETTTVKLDGPALIVGLELTPKARDPHQSLRNTTLSIYWDGEEEPSVWAPLADYFGSLPAYTPFSGLPMGVSSDRQMYSNWVMPFRDSAKIEFTNTGLTPVELKGKVTYLPIVWSDDLSYFHSKWKIEDSISTFYHQDWNVLQVEGPGRFVGLSLSVANAAQDSWWGEGDEKIYIDGEEFPSWFGTGTEDYFGYAWCSLLPFSNAYHNHSLLPGQSNYAHLFNNRFHILDDIPFSSQLRFDLEIWHWVDTEVRYASTAFWYSSNKNQDNLATPLPARMLVPIHNVPFRLDSLQ